uniref:Uncharacterized protein n=1 Tax=Rhizophora mucronata TaxID=61149 RepID=A0A2P2N1T0_RHIMU
MRTLNPRVHPAKSYSMNKKKKLKILNK